MYELNISIYSTNMNLLKNFSLFVTFFKQPYLIAFLKKNFFFENLSLNIFF